MNALTKSCFSLFLFTLVATCHAAGTKSFSFPRSTPEVQGVSSAAVLELVEALDQIDAMHSIMILRHGHVIAEGWWTPYDAESNHELYSLSKSFTSTAVGRAIAEGRFSLDDEVMKFFPEDAPAEPSANLKAMRVRDLLSMSAGHQAETSSAADKISAKSFLAHPVPHKPGTHFKYNTPATFMLSAIVQKQTGQTVLDYLRPLLFEPLGITNPVWNTNSQGISLGGYGLSVRTEDIARFGQLYLQDGKWEGRQLIPPGWVEQATSRQVSNGSNPKSDWEQGYGFQFWRCRHGAYRGDGAFGQYCIVLPEQDAVIAITSGVKDMQGVLNLLWDKLLPAFAPKRLKADASNRNLLALKLRGLTVRTAEGAESSALAARIFSRRFVFPANEQKLEAITVDRDRRGKGMILTVQAGGVTNQFSCGHGEWKKGRGSFGTYADVPAATSCAWIAEDALVLKQCFYETPYYVMSKLRFAGNEVFYDAETNVGFLATKQRQLVGRME